ncbi:MAG: DNA polymerase IV [Hyphomicrobiaceae bacterium]
MARMLCRDCLELHEPGGSRCPGCGSARLVEHPELETLHIAHIDCDAFYASVEKRNRPELADEPVIVGHAGGRGVVTTACYIARRFGVRSAMPMFRALELCPGATVIPPEMARYRRVSEVIRAIFLDETPIIEPVSLDEAYLDLDAAHRLHDRSPAEALARIAMRVEDEVGITVSVGLAPNKFLAKLASELRKPRGYSVIGAAEAASFLAPLAAAKINGVGGATARRLESMGVVTIGDLQRMSEMELVGRLGKFGRRLAQFAHGRDDRQVTPDRPTKSVSAETTFRTDTADFGDLSKAAAPLAERVAAQLAKKGLAGGTVVVKLKTAAFKQLTRNKKLSFPTRKSAVILEAALPLIEKEADGRAFRLIGIGVDQVSPAPDADPPDLFDEF